LSRARSLRVVALALGLCACATRADRIEADFRELALDGWQEVRSRDFVLSGRVERAELEDLAEDLASFVAVFERVRSARTRDERTPVHIHLGDYTARRALAVSHFIGGFIVPGLGRYSSIVFEGERSAYTRHTLLHEYTHFLLHRSTHRTIPRWYEEGLAEYLATTRRRGDVVSFGTAIRARIDTLTRLDDYDLGWVFAEHWPENPSLGGHAYGLAWALTHYLYSQPSLRESLTRYLVLHTQGRSGAEAYASAFGVPVAQLSQGLERHVAALAKGLRVGARDVPVQRLAIDTRWSFRQVPEPETAHDLGLLMLKAGARREAFLRAARLFEHALRVDPAYGRARAALALARVRAGDAASIDVLLAQAVADAPRDWRVYLYTGEAQLERFGPDARATGTGRPADATLAEAPWRTVAREAFRAADRLAPDRPAVLSGLGRTELDGGDTRAGIEALTRAAESGPWDPHLLIDLGRLHAEQGERERAAALWREVARHGDRESAARARALLLDQPP